MNKLDIKQGQRWLLRNGETVAIATTQAGETRTWPIAGCTLPHGLVMSWTPEGHYSPKASKDPAIEHDYDLIERHPEDARRAG